MGIGEKIYDLRMTKGMSQAALASLTGISQPQINSYENNKTVPKFENLSKIAYVLDTTTDYFYMITRD